MSSRLNDNNSSHVYGHTAQGWENIRTVFEQNLIDGLDIGASLCIYYRGKCVVDLCGGWKDAQKKEEPYTPDTLQLVYSTSKGITSAAIALCVERGWLDYDAPVAQYWPEFAANGKQVEIIYDIYVLILCFFEEYYIR
jgi:CubicO group peptidase (beta-lactamase class C family)